MIERKDGLTDDEGFVMDALIDAVQGYFILPVDHPQEQAEFLSAIHRCQDLLAVRIARRHYPEGWITYEANDRCLRARTTAALTRLAEFATTSITTLAARAASASRR